MRCCPTGRSVPGPASILGCCFFCMNVGINARRAWWPPASVTAEVFLLRCVFAFSQPSRVPVGSRVPGDFAGPSSPVIQPSSNQLLGLLTVWAGATAPASPSSLSAEGSRKCSRRSCWTAVESLDLIKTGSPLTVEASHLDCVSFSSSDV